MREELIYNTCGEQSRVDFSFNEVYWFVMWVLTTVLAVASTFWTFMPDKILHMCGIHYIPNRYWLLAWANQFEATWWTLTLVLHCGSVLRCHPKDSYFTMEDRHSRFGKPPPRSHSNEASNPSTVKKSPVPEIVDIPVTVVNNVLYRKHL
jgi:hypothetical protein